MNYDKTEMNAFVQSLYDAKMTEGKHGHYETMFHVVHKAIERATQPAQQAQKPVDESVYCFVYEWNTPSGLHRSTTYERWNGNLPDRSVAVYTAPSRELVQQARDALTDTTKHFGIARLHNSTLKDSEVRGNAHKAITNLDAWLEANP